MRRCKRISQILISCWKQFMCPNIIRILRKARLWNLWTKRIMTNLTFLSDIFNRVYHNQIMHRVKSQATVNKQSQWAKDRVVAGEEGSNTSRIQGRTKKMNSSRGKEYSRGLVTATYVYKSRSIKWTLARKAKMTIIPKSSVTIHTRLKAQETTSEAKTTSKLWENNHQKCQPVKKARIILESKPIIKVHQSQWVIFRRQLVNLH